MKFPRVSASAFFAAALVLLLGACSAKKDDALVVGMDLSYPPFETLDATGQPSGVSVDLARALGESLGRPVRIENMAFVGLIPALKSRRVDLIISSMTDTHERRESVAFSEPYLSTGLALLAGRNSPVESAADLDHPERTVAVRQGTTGEVWARANLKRAKILSLEKEASAVLEVLQGRADAFLYDQMSVWQNQRHHPDVTRALLAPITRESWAVALRPEDAVLRDKVNAFIERYRAEGGFDRLGEKYLSEQKTDFAAKGIPFFF